jgi:hypothetical protein
MIVWNDPVKLESAAGDFYFSAKIQKKEPNNWIFLTFL